MVASRSATAGVAGPVRGGAHYHNVVQRCEQDAGMPCLLPATPSLLHAAMAATAMALRKREVTARTVTGVKPCRGGGGQRHVVMLLHGTPASPKPIEAHRAARADGRWSGCAARDGIRWCDMDFWGGGQGCLLRRMALLPEAWGLGGWAARWLGTPSCPGRLRPPRHWGRKGVRRSATMRAGRCVCNLGTR